jgi:hypothetical protein
VSPRRLWGWEPTETTTYEYDDAGRLISSTTEREPEFDETDIAFLRALDELEQDTGRYGELISEALSPDSDPNNRDAAYHYVVENEPYMNFAALAVAQAQNGYYKRFPDVSEAEKAGHVWVTRRVPNKS